MEVRGPGDESRTEASIQLPPDLARRMKIMEGPSPLVQEIRWCASTEMSSHPRGEARPARPKPLGCLSVELVPGELVHDDPTPVSQQAADLIEDNGQAFNMMEGKAGYRHIETSGFLQIFDPALAEDPTVRRLRIDSHDVVAGADQRSRKPAISASHLEDPSGWRWQF